MVKYTYQPVITVSPSSKYNIPRVVVVDPDTDQPLVADSHMAALVSDPTSATTAALAAAVPSKIPHAFRLHVLGDSLSQNGLNLSMYPVAGLASGDAKNPWVWAHVLSQGKLRIGTIGATGGYDAAQIRETHLPTVLADLTPGDRVAVLAGTNNVGGSGIEQAKTDLTAIYDAILGAGGVPVACTIPPANADSSANTAARITLNLWIESNARAHGFQFLDFHKLLIDPATNGYRTGLNNDDLHPNGGGARAMGQLIADTLTDPNAPDPYLAAFNIGSGAHPADGVLVWGNACMMNSGLYTNRGDQFDYGFGTLTGGSGFSLVTVDGVAGRMQKVTRGASGPDNVSAITGYSADAIPGHRYYVGFKFKIELTDPVIDSSTKGVIQVNTSDGVILAGITEDGWNFSTPGVCTWASEFVMPDRPDNNLIMVTIGARGGEVSVYVGQLTIVDLSTLGVA